MPKEEEMTGGRVEYLVKGLIPERMITLLIGVPGSFKSWVLAGLAAGAPDGGPLFDAYACKPCTRVIYIDEDTPQSVYELRLEALGLGAVPGVIDQRPMTGFRLANDQHRQALCQEIHAHAQSGKVLVLIDCLAKVASGLDIDRTDPAVKAMGYLAQIRDAGATVVVSHHISIHRRGREPMNSTYIKAGADSILDVEKVDLEGRHVFRVNPESKRVLLTRQFAVEIHSAGDLDSMEWAFMATMDEMPVVPTAEEKEMFKLFPDTKERWTVKRISDSTGRDLPEGRIREALARLVEQRCLKKVIDPHDRSHAAYYQLHPDFGTLTSVYKDNIK